MTASTTLADICVVAAAEAFRGNGEIFGSGMGTIQTLGVRLARATFEPDLLVSDGEAFFVANNLPIGGSNKVIEGWVPFRQVFDTVWGGRRHVMMGASQIDMYGNSNIA
ncbi:MAG: Glutaconate CoA-transferase, partial [Actinomycetota bacterium]